MCLNAFTRCLRAPEIGRVHQSCPHDERKQPLLPKSALITTKNRPSKKTIKKVAFMPTLEDVHDSLSRKERRASLSSLSDHATMGTVDFYVGTTSSCLSSISLLTEVGSSVCGSSVSDVSFRHLIKQTPISHMRNISDTAVFGDETTTSSGKQPHPWSVWGSEPQSDSIFTYRDNTRCLLSTSTVTAASLDAPMSHGAMISGSLDITAPDCTLQADKIYDARVPVNRASTTVNNFPTHIKSCTHATIHSTKTAGDLNKKACNETLPPNAANPSTGSFLMTDTIPWTSQAVGTSAGLIRADQPGQQHECCIGVLSAFEAKFLSDEDKQAILEGGCHGLCSIQVSSVNENSCNEGPWRASSFKPSPPARGPSDRPARFISPMPSDIMPNARRGEGSTLPRLSRRRVAAEYKRPRSALALVEYPSHKAGRSRGILHVQPDSLVQANLTCSRNAIRYSKPSPLVNYRFDDLSSGSLNNLFSITHQPKRKLKRQVKYGDLRHEFENDGQLAEEARLTVQANEAQITVQAKEKSSSSRKLFRRLCALL
ncbi:hypothetical protein KCV07_g6766, partial [Aureobasidium melanogenum]